MASNKNYLCNDVIFLSWPSTSHTDSSQCFEVRAQVFLPNGMPCRRFLGLGKKKAIKSPTRPPRTSPPLPPTPYLPPPPTPPPPPPPPLPPAPPPPPQAEPLMPPSSDSAVAAPEQSCVLAPKRTCEWVAYKTVCKQVEDELCAQQQQVKEDVLLPFPGCENIRGKARQN